MKRIIFILFSLAVILITGIVLVGGTSLAAKGGKFEGCKTIPSGELVDSQGNPLTTGYNKYGYNYQARITNQGIEEYCLQRNDIPEGKPGHWDYDDCMEYFGGEPFELIMKWNDAWLSNKDCTGDGLLDRYYGYDSYIGSGAWLTNHQRGTYEGDNGKTCHWEYFVKIVAKPTADTVCNAIWGSFCIIESVYNDLCGGFHGIEFLEQPAGFGAWK